MGKFLTRSSIGQLAPTPAQLPFAQFGGNTPQLNATPSTPAITPSPVPQSPGPFQNPFSPNELQGILNGNGLGRIRRGRNNTPFLFGGGQF